MHSNKSMYEDKHRKHTKFKHLETEIPEGKTMQEPTPKEYADLVADVHGDDIRINDLIVYVDVSILGSLHNYRATSP